MAVLILLWAASVRERERGEREEREETVQEGRKEEKVREDI